MKRISVKVFAILAIGILVCCGRSSDKRSSEVGKKQESTTTPASNDLPNMTVVFSDGSQTNTRKLEGKTVLILYFPDCDHCQREAVQIQKNITGFNGYTIYFLTAAPRQEAETFAVNYKLHNINNVKFGSITVNDVLTNFGQIATPSLYIYNSDHRLVQKFNGETPIDLILQHIK